MEVDQKIIDAKNETPELVDIDIDDIYETIKKALLSYSNLHKPT